MKSSTWFKKLLQTYPQIALTLHILSVFGILSLGIGIFFYWYLPLSTHHGETLTVPDLRGLSVEEAKQLLGHEDLRLAIGDSAFRGDLPAGHILAQLPAPFSQVKIGRRIYLTLNQVNAPMMGIPNIFGSSLKNAEQRLASLQLRIGEVKYLPHPQSGRVLKLEVDGRIIDNPNELQALKVAQGSAIKAYIGDGMGDVGVTMPKLVGRPADEAEVYLLGLGLHISQLHWEVSYTEVPGTVLRQKPYYGEKLRKGQGVQIWVSSSGY